MPMTPQNFISLGPHGFHRLAYYEWGDPESPHLVVCVHGLTRNSRDFDFLATALEKDCRVVCLDVVGRGKSDWLSHAEDYGYPLYVADAAALLARLTAPQPASRFGKLLGRPFRRKNITVDWVGTSMGGLIGMMLAAQPNSPIRRLVLNDVGPSIPRAALIRIGDYVGRDPRFPSLDEFEAYIRKISAPFGPLTDAQWRHLTIHCVRRMEDGSYGFLYDPNIALPFRNGALIDVELWPVWDKVGCRTLVLRGENSDLLLKDTAREMQARGPGARIVEFSGIGHAPMLMSDDQIGVVREFVLGGG